MKISYVSLLSLCFSLNVPFLSHAKDEKQTKIRDNVAYVKIEMGEFFGLISKHQGEITVKINTKNAYGFQGEPTTESQKSEKSRIDEYLKNNISDIVSFQNLNCVYTFDEVKTKIHKDKEGNQTAVFLKAEYDIKCDASIKGHDVKLNFTHFSGIKTIKVAIESRKTIKQVIVGNQGTVKLQ